MILRWQEDNLRRTLSVRRAVHLTGARQCGKSTLAAFVAGREMRHLTLDDVAYLKAAHDDPWTFVDRPDGKTLVIDEIQKEPELLNAIKMRVDRSQERGQYLITGSSNLHFVKAVTDSLAGRLGRIRLRPLCLGELMSGKGDFLRRSFARDFVSPGERLDKRDVLHCAFRGGYPEMQELDARSRRDWCREYLNDLLTKDVQDVTEIRKVEALKKVLDWLLAYSSKFFDVKELGTVAHLSRETTENYLTALKALYLVDGLLPWAGSDYAKLGKRTKRFVADSGLLANALEWDEDAVYYDDDKCGKLVETWVHNELACLADYAGGMNLFQYRDSDKREIDFIVQNSEGAMLGIEVKSGTVSPEDFKHLRWFAANLAKTPFTGIVLYSGKDVLSFGEGFYAVPLAALGA